MSGCPDRPVLEQQTGWLKHIKLVLEAAAGTVDIICRQNKRYTYVLTLTYIKVYWFTAPMVGTELLK